MKLLNFLVVGLFIFTAFIFVQPANAQAPKCTDPTNPATCTIAQPGADGESLKNVKDVIGTITPPQELNDIVNNPDGTRRNPSQALGLIISNLVKIVYAVAGILLLFMLIYGAIQWMTSGGSKEGIQTAQKRIVAAIVGFILLALAALVANLIARVTGFDPIVIN